jgi:hypothetical protein
MIKVEGGLEGKWKVIHAQESLLRKLMLRQFKLRTPKKLILLGYRAGDLVRTNPNLVRRMK